MSEGTSISLHQRPFLVNFVQWIVPPVFDQPPHAITFISFVLGEVVSNCPAYRFGRSTLLGESSTRIRERTLPHYDASADLYSFL